MANEEAPIWKRKIITCNYMPSNAEEEACRANNTSRIKTRQLVEIGSPLKFDSNNPWKIKKKITPQVLYKANLVISYFETFNYILPYWYLDKAKQLVNGDRKGVAMWDGINDIKFNEDAGFIFRKLINDDYSLSVMGLFNIHRLGVGDEIGLYWDPRFQRFMFKLLSKVCRKKIFSNEVNNTSSAVTRKLIETGPAQTIHSNNIIHMRKKITSQDITFGELRISFFAMFDCILPYWKLELARRLVNGNVVSVGLWDVTEEKYGRTNRYEDVSFTFRKLCSDDYSLTCMTLINDHGLGVGNEIAD